MSDKTLCMIGVNGDKMHYDYHSLYGLTEAQATRIALDQIYGSKRSPLISRCVLHSFFYMLAPIDRRSSRMEITVAIGQATFRRIGRTCARRLLECSTSMCAPYD